VTGRFAEHVRTPRTFEAAIDEIVAGIGRARLRQGDRLPHETELAQELGISKPTLRQALRVLQRSGVLDVRPGKGGGIFVASDLPLQEAVAEGIALETNAVVEILRGRRVLEGAVTHAASAVATHEDYEELERILRLLAAHRDDAAAIARADAMFHSALGRATHNRLLVDAMRLVARQLAPLRDLLPGGREEAERIIDVHTRQIRAMRARELDQLDAVLDEHFRVLEQRFSDSLGQLWDTLFGPNARSVPRPFEPAWKKLASLSDEYRPHAWRERLRTQQVS
jgi:GntR family transcriptional repressor for pyruvate dehydrogenase complex